MSSRFTAAALTAAALMRAACDATRRAQSPPHRGAARRSLPGDSISRRAISSVKPGDDFYRYADGHWLEAHTIPADRTALGLVR